MKKVLFTVLCSCIVSIIVASEVTTSQRRILHRKSRPSGGLVEKPYSGKVFRVQNLQSDYEEVKLDALTTTIRRSVLIPIVCTSSSESGNTDWFALADRLVAQKDVGAGALLINDPKLPIELISPDRRWGILNIAPLKSDGPSPELFEKRFTKAYWGIVARTLGAGMSSFPGCVLVPFSNMKELDAITATQPCPEPFNKMIDTGKAYGIGVLTISTYRTACEQGWAPAPTNDVQKASWHEVHAIPAKPMKIEFDPKKGR